MLQLNNICKSYTTGSFTQKALDGVSISFRDNEFVAILGPSGSGKTTLLNIVGGLDHYDSGDLVIEGISTKQFKDRDWDAYRNNRVGFVFQSYNLIPHQTVLANVELALTLSGVSREERRERARKALERVGLGDHIDKKPSQMSGGQMQRVAIARALINDPEILLADEPTGALDSKTSVQIMDLLKEIADDRLVVMVTHNPELAEQYATRIVSLADGRITSDTDAYVPTAEEVAAANGKPARRTHMSLLTALSLSFNNLMTKKGRTFMTAFAGSIGIIGIAAILALANGVNNYIKTVEEETLSVYPLQILSSGFDFTSMVVGMNAAAGDDEDDASSSSQSVPDVRSLASYQPEEGKIGEFQMMTRMFASFGNNDLAALKSYFDSGESGIEEYVSSIYYEYAVTPQVFDPDTTKGVRQVNPDTSFTSLGIGSGSSTNSLVSMSMSTDMFSEMMENDVVAGQYEVVAGHWPEKGNELVLVLSQTGRISDFLSYVLGLRDKEKLDEMVRQFTNEEEVTAPTDELDITYDDILGMKFKLVSATSFYKYDEEYNVWVDKSSDEEFMKAVVRNGEDLVIAGIVKPKPDARATALTMGVYYTPALTRHIVEVASQSQIVKDQLADPKRDVFSGKLFDDMDDQEDNEFDMSSLFTIDEQAMNAAFKFDTSAFDSAGLDFSSIDLSQLDPSQFDLSAMDLSKLDLSKMDLSKYDLSSLDPSKIDLSGVDLSKIDLSKVDVPDIDWNNVNLSGVDLSAIDFSKVEVPPITGEDLAALFPELSPEELGSVLQSVNIRFTDGGAAINEIATEAAKGYPAWKVTHKSGTVADYLQQLDMQQYMSRIIAVIDMDSVQQQVATGLAARLGTTPEGFWGVVSQRISQYYMGAMAESLRPQLEEALKDYGEIDFQDEEQLRTVMGQIAQQVMGEAMQQTMVSAFQKVLPDILGQVFEQVAPPIITGIVEQVVPNMVSDIIGQVVPQLMQQYAKTLGEVIGTQMQASMSRLSDALSNAMSFDEEAFRNAFQFNMDPDELSELMLSMMRVEEHSFDNNLKKLGYADFNKPSEISIFPRDFESKEHVIGILDAYNDRMREVDEDKVISYTDIVGTLMESVTTIVNMISTVLIAFVAISLIVSSIMIAVITYISVLERRKEIGILRAIGASKRDVSHVFNAETVIEGLVAGLLGVGITALGCIPANIIVYNIYDVPNVALLPPDAAAILVVISVVLTVAAGIIPAGSASRKDPVEALRSE